MEEYTNASRTAINKKRQIEKLKSSNNIKPERADEALEDFQDAQKHEAVLKSKLDAVSEKLRPSLMRHMKEMNADMFNAMTLHARTGLAFQQQALKDLQNLKNDIGQIPGKNSKDVIYIHQPATSLQEENFAVATASPSRTAHSPSPSMSSSDILSPPLSAADAQHNRHFRDGTQSMIVPPTHLNSSLSSPMTKSPSTNSRIHSLAQSVVLPSGATGTVKGKDRVVDDRQRVDSQTAARTLANMRF